MNLPLKRPGYDYGFSLIEILIAVVVLATGLLALTALQGKLAQASAEAKTRSRVASMLATRMEFLRAAQYDNVALDVPAGGDTDSDGIETNGPYSTCAGGDAWICATQTESATDQMKVYQRIRRFTSAVGAVSFAVNGGAPANVAIPEFKRITLAATWKDASGGDHRLGVSSDVSSLTLSSKTIPNQPPDGSAGGRAIVRQESPVVDGVIPLTSGNDATAASNPRPEVLELTGSDRKVVGTRFNVLTYSGDTGAVRIQRRVETSVIKCTCEYGRGNQLPVIYREPKWPAVWDGTQYKLSKTVLADGNAPGTAANAGPTVSEQSALCTECCRDHHDTATSTPKFDPERTAGVSKYRYAAGVLLPQTNTSSGEYLDACRLIRVDGFWRTAADTYSRHFALLPTKASTLKPTRPATTGVPTDTAVTDYGTFAKQYVGGITGGSATPPSNADSIFSGYGTLVTTTPSVLPIEVESPADTRYLHARGLYIDSLEADARALIGKALADKPRYCPSPSTGTTKSDAECVLLYLPVSTINLTELANWVPRKNSLPTTVIQVDGDNDNVYVWNVGQPSRSATQRDTGTTGATADSVSSINSSNVGLTRMDQNGQNEIDPNDGTAGTDFQQFSIGSTVDNGHSFWVNVIGPPSYNVSWTGAGCNVPEGAAFFKCTNLPDDQSRTVTITIAGYNYRGADLKNEANPCGGGNTDVPQYYNYAIGTSVEKCAVTLAGVVVPGTCSTITPSRNVVIGTDGRKIEATEIDVGVKENEIIRISATSALTAFPTTGCSASPARPIYNYLDY